VPNSYDDNSNKIHSHVNNNDYCHGHHYYDIDHKCKYFNTNTYADHYNYYSIYHYYCDNYNNYKYYSNDNYANYYNY